MVVPILCLVCLCLLVWVMLLKTEISRLTLKYEGKHDRTKPGKANSQKGMRTYKIG